MIFIISITLLLSLKGTYKNQNIPSNSTNTILNLIDKYIYLLLPNLDYIQSTSISSSSTPSVGTNISSSFSQFLLKTINESKNKIFKAKK